MTSPKEALELTVSMDGSLSVHPLPVEGRVTIGRGETNRVRVQHKSVSREHAVLHMDRPMRIQDLGGTNGTFVRDVARPSDAAGTTHGMRNIKGQTVLVAVGDSIDIGRVTITIERAGTRPSVQAAASFAVGSVVAGRFVLERPLGEGGTGVIWAARHLVTNKQMALKVLKAEGATHPLRLIHEARASCAVRHPNVREVHDVLEAESEHPIMVMEYLDGETLASRLAREPKLSLATTASVLLPVTSAVGAAHAIGVVHRDLKPDNIFLSGPDHDHVKVMDFGIARLTVVDDDAHVHRRLTATGALIGTPLYMSPEQAFGEKDVDFRADVWALGIVIHQCLAGALPTVGENLGQVIRNIVSRPVPPLSDVVPGLPGEVVDLVSRMLSRSRAHRPGLHEVFATLAPYAGTTAPAFGPPLMRSQAIGNDDD